MITVREGALLVAGAVVVGTGMWLTSSGRPYGTPLLTTHKLVDLAAVVAVAFIVYRAFSGSDPFTVSTPVLILVALVALVALVTGGMLSAMQSAPTPVFWVHRAAGFLLPVLAGYLVYLVRAHP